MGNNKKDKGQALLVLAWLCLLCPLLSAVSAIVLYFPLLPGDRQNLAYVVLCLLVFVHTLLATPVSTFIGLCLASFTMYRSPSVRRQAKAAIILNAVCLLAGSVGAYFLLRAMDGH